MARHRGLRAELASILSVDEYSHAETHAEPPPPPEPVAIRLAHLLFEAARHHSDARTLHAFLPALMLRLFGYVPGQGWLENASALPSKDRDALLALALPDGPLHAFCVAASDPHHPAAHRDMLFEFPVRNLPPATRAAVLAAPSVADGPPARSFLAPLLRPLLKPAAPDTLVLSPLDYFTVCLVASPANKCTADGVVEGVTPVSQKRIKRSTSLPSTRALYNQVLAAYAATLDPAARAARPGLLLPALLDFLFLRPALATPDAPPAYSAAAADAAAAVMLTLAPRTPDGLDLDSAPSLSAPVPHLDLKLVSTAAAVYRFVPFLLRNVFAALASNERVTVPFVAYVRVLALYMAPWRGSVHDAMRAMLFPRPRPHALAASVGAGNAASSPSSASARPTGLQALSNTLTAVGAHLASPQRSPQNISPTKEARWRTTLAPRQAAIDRPLLRLAVVRAPAQRVSAASDGNKAMTVLSEAATAARLPVDPAAVKDEELSLCLDALRGQRASSAEQRGGKWERNYIPYLAAALGARAPAASVLANISGIVAGGAQSVRGVVDKVSGRPSAASSPGSTSRIRERRQRALSSSCIRSDVPFLGSVWDRPIAQGEWEPLVMAAYWLALKLEPTLGYVPDTRFMGRIWLWALVGVGVTVYVGVKTLVSMVAG